MWQKILDLIEKLGPALVSLAGVWLGWRLGSWSQLRERRVERLNNKLEAQRELMGVVANIPPELDLSSMKHRLEVDPKLRADLSQRLVRLFGLRIELIPFLEKELIEFIEDRFRPLYKIEAGTYTFLEGQTDNFAAAIIELRSLSQKAETSLTKEYDHIMK